MYKYALIVGVGSYNKDSGVENIPFAINDAWEISKILRHPRFGQFNDLNVVYIKNGRKELIEKKVIDLFTNKNLDDLIFLYFSCHGYRDEDGSLYLLPSNYEKNYLYSTAVSMDFIAERMKQSKSRKQVLVIDSCFSGSVRDTIIKAKGDEIYFDQLSGEGRYIMAASSAVQPALLDENEKYSLFTRYFIDGLRSGDADTDEDGLISASEIFNYVQKNVQRSSNNKQTPKSWWLEVEGEIFLSRSNKSSNPLIAEMKLDPVKFIENMLLWGIMPIVISDGKEINRNIITKPIETKNELEKCYFSLPNVVNVRNEIISANRSRMWLFVSPDETGKTSMLYYLACELYRELPKKFFVKIEKVPRNPKSKDLLSLIIRNNNVRVEDAILIFDGIVSNSSTQELLMDLRNKKVTCWCTCTPIEYQMLEEMDFPIKELFTVREVPGYISDNRESYEAFLREKLSYLSEEDKQSLLEREKITISQLVAFANLGSELNIGLKRFDKDSIATEYKIKFSELSKGSRLIAQMVSYYNNFSVDLILEIAKREILFNEDDFNKLLESDFIDKDMIGNLIETVSISYHYDKYIKDQLSNYEKEIIIDLLLDIALDQNSHLYEKMILRYVEYEKNELSSNQLESLNQLRIKIKGGLFCLNCNKYFDREKPYCPMCGRGLGRLANDDDEVQIKQLENIVDKVIPFPVDNGQDVSNKQIFKWDDIDFLDFSN